MSSYQRDESSSLSEASASPSNSTSSAASAGVSPDTTNTTLTTKITTKTETITATATGSGTGTSRAISAGIGAGTGIAIAGLMLLLVAAVVFCRRRKRRHPDPAPPTSPTPPTPITETRSNVSLESLLEPGLTGLAALPFNCRVAERGHGDIESELYAQGLLINTHVRTNYHLDPVLVEPETLLASLCRLQLSEGTCRTVVRLSIDPNTRRVAICHLLALAIFSNLDPHSVGSLSLLPPVLKELFKSRPEAYWESQVPLVETALVGWKRLTVFLMHENPNRGTTLPLLPSVESQIKTLATLLQDFLAHFAHTDDDSSHGVQQADLEHIIGDCVKLGYRVFSDLRAWRFTFPQQERGVVVLPGLEIHSDEMMELYDSPRTIMDPEVVKVDITDE
ncbi:hypothetical protein NCS52_00329400 [Fusarium sp. LHS14.1]|nr:hypothetical protein NCS52_00329400 [Fusarium sp. LHS14.1]